MDFKQNLCAALSNACGMTAEQIGDMLETPPNPAMGDFALPCFKLAKTFRKAPPAIAAELARNLGEIEGFSRIETAGGYLRFFPTATATVLQPKAAERISAWIILP